MSDEGEPDERPTTTAVPATDEENVPKPMTSALNPVGIVTVTVRFVESSHIHGTELVE